MKFLSSIHYMIWLVISAIFFAAGEFASKKFALSPKLSLVLLVAVLDVVSTLLWLPAMMNRNVLSTTGTMWSILSLVATVLLGILLFGEKLSFIDTLGLITAFISIILLSIG